MAIQTIANQLRSLRDRYWSLVADALRDIEQIVSNIYRDMGWFQVTEKSSGIRKDVLQTPRLMIVGGANNAPIGEIRNIDGRLVILLDSSSGQGILNIETKNPNTGESMQVTPNNLTITDIDGELLFSIAASQDNLGNDVVSVTGQADNGALNSFALNSNPFSSDVVFTFKDAVDGDTVATLKSELGAGTLSVKKGADNEISAVADAAAVVITVKNASSDSTIKPESVVTPRLGVGGSAPGTDGHATVSTFLGVGRSTPAGGETLGVTGDTDITGALDVSGAITNPLLTNEFVIALLGGTLSSESASSHRTNLDVYSKAEVDAAIAAAISAAIAGLSIDSVSDHDHGGAVSAGGGHSHTITYTP